MLYCQQCGHPLEEEQTFCTNCGAKTAQAQTDTEQRRDARYSGKPLPLLASKRSKILAGIGVVIVLAIISSYFILKSIYKPTRLAENFILAVTNQDAKEVAQLLNSKQSDVKVDEKSAKQLIEYYQNNPSEFSELKKKLTEDALLYENGSFPEQTSTDIALSKVGKIWLLFDRYALIPRNLYIVVSANRNSSIYIDGKKVEDIKEDEERTFGPYLPINHKVQAEYKGEYTNVKQEETVSPNDEEEENKVYVEFDLTGDYVYIYSNNDNAVLFVNGKSTGLKIADLEEFGPVPTDGSMTLHAEVKTAKGTLKSNKVKIEEPGESIELLFDEEEMMEDIPLDSMENSGDEQLEIENVVMNHYSNISNGDYEAAYQLFSSNRRNEISYEKWIKGLQNNFKNEVSDLNVESIESDRATVSFHLTSYDKKKDGTTLVQEWGGKWYLVKESDGWKLDTPEITKLNTRTE